MPSGLAAGRAVDAARELLQSSSFTVSLGTSVPEWSWSDAQPCVRGGVQASGNVLLTGDYSGPVGVAGRHAQVNRQLGGRLGISPPFVSWGGGAEPAGRLTQQRPWYAKTARESTKAEKSMKTS